jgi:hypothetical protein
MKREARGVCMSNSFAIKILSPFKMALGIQRFNLSMSSHIIYNGTAHSAQTTCTEI